MRYIKNENIVLRKILPSYFMVDITKCYNNNYENMFITDEVGANIWETISNGDDFERIYEKFIKKLTDEKTPEMLKMIRTDLDEYLELLIREECLSVR